MLLLLSTAYTAGVSAVEVSAVEVSAVEVSAAEASRIADPSLCVADAVGAAAAAELTFGEGQWRWSRAQLYGVPRQWGIRYNRAETIIVTAAGHAVLC